MDIVLASASEERKNLLKKVIKKFEIFPNTAKIRIKQTKNVSKLTRDLAYFKALRICLRKPQKIILGADTLIEIAKEAVGKPKNKSQAKQILNFLSDKKIKAHTSFCLAYFKGQDRPIIKCFSYRSQAKIKKLTKKDIEKYLKTNKWKNRAAAIDIFDKLFTKFLERKLTNKEKEIFAGLPTNEVKKKLKEFKKILK
ncbi:MAG: Maf family protein [Candidatus Micrarchaeota archaeon]|nr:Maf family protein [Candidatus Micrarchaeota archaeon]